MKIFKSKKRSLSDKAIQHLYANDHAITDYFPVIDTENNLFILEDGLSSGIFFEILPVPTENLSVEDIASIEDNILNMLT